MSADRQNIITPGVVNDLLDPYACSCLPTSYHYTICSKIKWSTLSITVALIIIIVYASSGLYTLIDVTTLMSIDFTDNKNETIFWSILSSPETIRVSWISLCVYFLIVLLTILLLCGIQLSKPWLLFLWSILMIVMLLADGIVTVLSLIQHHQQTYRPPKQVKILFVVMVIRLTVSLCGIFIAIFHFRRLNKAHSEYIDRQRMLVRYNAESTCSSHDNSWAPTDSLLNPPKDPSIDYRISDVPLPLTLPRAKLATIQRRPLSTMFRSRNERLQDDSNEDIRYNVPLDERFYPQQL
ncbi:unnamed protein product [Adineta ricciae]|uniref:Uncharacterized protein n=1 Tax=Adineta ricciae TaxID=249248 RepID=A0A815Z2E5_ADIRI|nr:unnamed protein product [Adineta ricciae]